jgi:hypothetical protein
MRPESTIQQFGAHEGQRHHLSRYGIRELLAMHLGQLGSASKTEENIIELMWKYGQSARDVAAHLDIPVAAVQSVRHQAVSALLAEIRHPHRQPKIGRVAMKHEDALNILGSAIASAGDPKSLDAVRKHRDDIRNALDEGDVPLDEAQWAKLEENPEWLAQIYDSLAEKSEPNEESAVARAIADLRREEEQEIGEAFAALIQELPDAFHDWPMLFKNVATVDRAYQSELLSHRSVQASEKASIGLTAYGMTPTVFFSAARGLEMLFNRTERAARAGMDRERATEAPRQFKLPKSVILEFGDGRGRLPISDDLIVAEMISTPGLVPGAEKPHPLALERIAV